MILHCMKKSIWEERKNKEYWGQINLDAEGFLHCSTIEYFWRIIWLFEEEQEEFVIVCTSDSSFSSSMQTITNSSCSSSKSQTIRQKYPMVGQCKNPSVSSSLCPQYSLFFRSSHKDFFMQCKIIIYYSSNCDTTGDTFLISIL